MGSEHTIDEELVRRLPLPLAQLYRRAHNAHGAQNRHQAAYFLWEAALKLLGCTAVAEYAARNQPDSALTERLSNLARPAVGHWWEFVRLLVPVLADGGDEAFGKVRDLVLGRGRDDLPRAAGLDAALREVLDGTSGARSTVRLSELFERLVRYRNRELGHGALGLRPTEFYERMGGALLAGVAELLSWLDVLAGRRLLYVGEVRQAGGVWVAQRHELVGEAPRSVAPLELPRDQAAQLPDGDRLYLQGSAASPRPLFPLLLHDPETMEVLFLNARRGQQRTEYLSYATGRTVERKDLVGAQQSLLAQLLGLPVDAGQLREWAERAESEEEKAAPATPETASAPRRRVGEFEVFSELGRGGMGVVYRAWQPSLGRQVAVKKLLRAGDPRTEARFLREIRALGRVEHPSLVKVFTSGSDGDDWFYAMELVEGADLAGVSEQLAKGAAPTLGDADWQRAVTTACDEARRRERRLSDGGGPPLATPTAPPAAPPPIAVGRGQEYVTRVAEVVRQAAEAAHSLHEAGVVHRDIKPGNILVTPDGAHAVLMDLGLAQLADEMDRKLTRTREFIGTLRYASPEQVLAVAPVDRRSDVYSLGATLWEMLTLRPLYGATEQTSSPELMQRIQTQDAESVRAHNPRVPRDLEAIVLKCLEKDPQRRYPTAQALADDLGRLLRHEPVQARPIGSVGRTLRRIRRRPKTLIAILLLAFGVPALLALGYWWYWDTYKRLKIEYYATYADRWESPVGIRRLTLEEAHHRNFVWKFQVRGGRVERVELVNGSDCYPPLGQLIQVALERIDMPSRTCSMEYMRDESGQVIKVIGRDRSNNVDWTFHYVTATQGFYADEEGIPRAHGGTGAAHVRMASTSAPQEGYRERMWFVDEDGKPQADANGVFCYRSEFDSRGLQVRLQTLGADDRPIRCKSGYAEVAQKYDDQGNLIEKRYCDEFGRPTRLKDGTAGFSARYDAYGNWIEMVYLDEAGQPTLNNTGLARASAKYDEHGNLVELISLDGAGRPTVSEGGIARYTADYDERGDMIGADYFDETGQPTRHKDGHARWTAKYDADGNMIEKAFFDELGRPTLHKDGYARWTGKFDGRGHAVEYAYFDEADMPVRIKQDYARWTAKYDKHGNQIEQAYFDEAGRPTRNRRGAARWTSTFDKRGNRIEQAFFDEVDRPTRNQNRAARWRTSYDDRGNPTEETYFDETGAKTRHKDGYVRWTGKYDERGDIIAETYYDAANQPTRSKDGYASVAMQRDRSGNVVEGRFFNPAGRPTWEKKGYSRITKKYDERGHLIEEAYFDEADHPIECKQGFARWTATYDERGRRIEEVYFDEADRPTNSPEGFSRVRQKYDERGNKSEAIYLDGQGRPAKHQEGNARVTWKYDARGNQIEQAYLDAAGQPVRVHNVARMTRKYDARGNEIEEAYFDGAGQPTSYQDGSARVTWKYDERGNRTEAACFDAMNQPVRIKAGYARVTWKYDERDRRVQVDYFDEMGQPVPYQDQSPRKVWSYDDRGNQVETIYKDGNGRPVRIKDGYARTTAKYDERDNQIEAAYFDETGAPMRNDEIIARWTAKFDDRDNQVEQAYFDEAGKPIRSKYGYARWTASFNDRGSKTDEAYFDIAGQPATDKNGIARWVARYDDRGREIERQFYDAAARRLVNRVIVGQVAPGGQGARLGLKTGDILLTYGGKQIKDRDEFVKGRRQEHPGDKPVELSVRRGVTRLTFSVAPGPLDVEMADHLVPAPSDSTPRGGAVE
jgi:YD repeat-containing protein